MTFFFFIVYYVIIHDHDGDNKVKNLFYVYNLSIFYIHAYGRIFKSKENKATRYREESISDICRIFFPQKKKTKVNITLGFYFQ